MNTMLAVAKQYIIGIKLPYITIALAVLLLVIALPALVSPKRFREELKTFLATNETVRLFGLVYLIIAFIILNTQMGLSLKSPRAIMAAIGYLMAIKGVLLIWLPSFSRNMSAKFLKSDKGIYTMGAIWLLCAAALIYLGGWVY